MRKLADFVLYVLFGVCLGVCAGKYIAARCVYAEQHRRVRV